MSETIGQSKTPKRSRFTNMPQSRLQTAAPLNSDDVMPSVTQPVQPPVQPASLQRSEASRKGDAAGQGSEATEKRETSQPASPVLPKALAAAPPAPASPVTEASPTRPVAASGVRPEEPRPPAGEPPQPVPEKADESKPKIASEAEKIEKMLQLIRVDLPPSSGPGQRMFFPKELPDRLTLARQILLQYKHKIPERSIALTGVLNLLDQMEKVHGGPFDSPVGWDEEERMRLREMVGEFKERPQESFSFGLDNDLQHRLRMVAEYTGVRIRQVVATGIALVLKEMEDVYGRSFNDVPKRRLPSPSEAQQS